MRALLIFVAVTACNEPAKAPPATPEMTADDLAVQYGIVKRNRTRAEACTHAGLVADAYLHAKDEANYKKWTATQAEDCSPHVASKAGIIVELEAQIEALDARAEAALRKVTNAEAQAELDAAKAELTRLRDEQLLLQSRKRAAERELESVK